jgi:hypothetical protein
MASAEAKADIAWKPEIPWYETAAFRRAALFALVAAALIKAGQGVFLKENDFTLHMELGRAALKSVVYGQPEGGLVAAMYMPGRILFNAVLALLPEVWARALVFVAAIGALMATAQIWRRLADAVQPVSPSLHFAAAFLALLLLGHWTARDLDDCGLQIILLFLLSMAGWCLWRGARIMAGFWLAVAITYKTIPVIFLPLLIWKRRWVEAAATVVVFAFINVVAPVVVWGPQLGVQAMSRNAQQLWISATVADPSENGVDTPTHRNQNLQLGIARILQTYQPGHPLFIHRRYDDNVCPPDVVATTPPEYCAAHPLFFQFLDLPARTAKAIALAIILLMGLAVAWRMRRPWALATTSPPPGPTTAFAPEWAVACAFTALLSPLTWQHHLVLALPCAYLVIRDLLANPGGTRWRWIALGAVIVFTWIIQRMVLGKQLAIVAMSYKDDVLAVLILIVLALTLRAERQVAGTPVPAAAR